MSRLLALPLCAITLSGCASVHEQVAQVCAAHGWGSPQCAYAQQVGLQAQRNQAAHSRAMMYSGARVLTGPRRY